jgi:molecular chaperone DnaK
MDKFYDYGIDLGTTNSCVARTTLSDVVVFQNLDNMNVTPSAVYIDKRGRMFVGRKAYDKVVSEPENTAIEFKRFMGILHKEKFASTGRTMTPVELSAEILKSIREDVLRQTGSPLCNAIITVPASFDTRQCDATTQAGKLAGLDNIILLQEPIAAAMAYGMKPNAKNQYWMVYDFGGGTLDVAIISTFNNSLTVINHQGDNRLGGKNIDALLCDKLIFPKIMEKYRLTENPESLEYIKRRLRTFAETAKKALSTKEETVIDIYDIGEDMDGEFIELSIKITRDEFNNLISELVESSISLAKKSITDAGINYKDLNKIVLVGGSTLISYIRERLSDEFSVPLDTSIDPITVVARGAAIYGSTVKVRDTKAVTTTTTAKLSAKIEYPALTSERTVNIVGKIVNASKFSIKEISIDNVTGIWSSGWVNLINASKGIFDVDVVLQPDVLNFFKIRARDSFGNVIEVENNSFTVRHNENALQTSSPPIPHSICVEKIKDGESTLEVMIKKGTQLPAKAIKRFIANKTLLPNSDDFIAIKIWEGENKYLTLNEWIGNVYIRGDMIKRIIPEGFEIEVSITIDESRRIEVSAYVPHLDLLIDNKFMYNCEPLNLNDSISNMEKELETLLRVLHARRDLDSEDMLKLAELLRQLKSVQTEFNECKHLVGIDDDRIIDVLRAFNEIKGLIQDFEKDLINKNSGMSDSLDISRAEKAVRLYGNESDMLAFELLQKEYLESQNKKEVIEKIVSLKTRVMLGNFEFLKLAFLQLSSPSCSYSNIAEALELKGKGQLSLVTGDVNGLQNAVISLLNLSVDYNSDLINQKALTPDLR